MVNSFYMYYNSVLTVLLLTYMTGGMYEVEPVKVIITRNKVIEVS